MKEPRASSRPKRGRGASLLPVGWEYPRVPQLRHPFGVAFNLDLLEGTMSTEPPEVVGASSSVSTAFPVTPTQLPDF